MHGSLGHIKAAIFRRKQRQEKQKGKFNKKNLNYISDEINQLEFPEPSKYELKKINASFKKKFLHIKEGKPLFMLSL